MVKLEALANDDASSLTKKKMRLTDPSEKLQLSDSEARGIRLKDKEEPGGRRCRRCSHSKIAACGRAMLTGHKSLGACILLS